MGDAGLLDFLLTLPQPKRQPNLLFAAWRLLWGVPGDAAEFRALAMAHDDELREVMLTRATQTNEPARCAVLLPVLAGLPQPLALIEVGASAGLCLQPDRYRYDYDGHIVGDDDAAPYFPCTAAGDVPLPSSLPDVVWRAGLDLDPVDVTDADRVAWLEALVWPEQADRLDRLRGAIEVARRAPPPVLRGDLRYDLAALAAEAPRNATRVIFHTAVLAYVTDADQRAAFAREARQMCDVWIANESPRVFPDIAARAGIPPAPGRFLLSVNGEPVAWTDPHGAAIEWIG